MKKIILLSLFTVALFTQSIAVNAESIRGKITTSEGDIYIEIYPDKAPLTTSNFIRYVKKKKYNGTIFHRVIPNFMIQGGGFNQKIELTHAFSPIVNESRNDLYNNTGFIAMARTSDPHSATNQFFINTSDNYFLNPKNEKFGYAVFGKVVQGMDVVHKIEHARTGSFKGMKHVPIKPMVILKIQLEGI